MTDEIKTDQATEQSAQEPKTINEYLGLSAKEGFAAFKKDTANEKKETQPEGKEKVPAETKSTEKKDVPCDDCPGGKNDKAKKEEKVETRTPYKTLKVNGKDHVVYSEEELLALAQKGVDYTKKTQTVADDRKEVLSKSEEINKISENINSIMDRLENKDKLAPLTVTKEGELKTPEQIKDTLFKKFEIDVDTAEPETLKMVEHMAEVEATHQGEAKKNEELQGMVQMVMADKAVAGLGEIIKETRKDYPFEEHYDDDGNNLTGQQYVAMLHAKAKDPKNEGRQLPELAVEVVKELSATQVKHQESVKQVPDKPDKAWLKENHPELYESMVKSGKDQGVADYLKDQEESPPSLKQRKAPVDTKSEKKEIYETTKDAFKAFRRDNPAP